jgi:methylglyoxal reductase
MGDRWEKQSRKPEQVEDNAKVLGVSLEEADIVQMKKDIETLL